jgi:rod shape-determining protein MreD
MRLLKLGLYILFILALQTVVFARLNIWGAAPDLILVSVIIFAVQEERKNTILFAAAAALLQDILSHGIYMNTVMKILIGYLVSSIKEGFAGEEFFLAAGSVAVLTPLALLVEGAVFYFFFSKPVDVPGLVTTMFLATIYNLVLVPVLFPLIRRAARA